MKKPYHAFDRRFVPHEGAMEELIDALHRFGAALIGQPGLIGVELLIDVDRGACYFVEKWTSRNARIEAKPSLNKEVIASLQSLGQEIPRETELLCYDIGRTRHVASLQTGPT